MEAETGATEKPVITVMVVDDSQTIRNVAEKLLHKEGFAVVTAENGFAALPKVVDHEPDIIFLDIMMPKLDGYQTCSVLKNSVRFKQTPVVMLSSKDGVFDKAKGRLVGSEQFVTKPFTKDDLLEAIDRYAHSN